ncbi:MAG TPA: ATP-binding protein [Bacteroidota bacterium]|nr:ATP-binding protein [Bacteroidota bacterium]
MKRSLGYLAVLFGVFLVGAVVHLTQKREIVVPVSPNESIEFRGSTVASDDELEFLAAWNSNPEVIHFRAHLRDGRTVESIVPLRQYYPFYYITLDLLLSVLIFILGLSAYLMRPGQQVTRMFYYTSCAVAIAVVGVKTITFTPPQPLGYVLSLVFFVAYGLIPILFYHFITIFSPTPVLVGRKVLKGLYVASVVLAGMHWMMYADAAVKESIPLFDRSHTVSMVQNGFFFILMILAVAQLVWSYRKTRSLLERRKIRLTMFGICIGTAPFIFLWLLPQVFGGQPLIPEIVFKMFLLMIPLSFGISILRYRIMDLDVLINRGAVYAIVVGVLLVVYAGLISVAVAIIGETFSSSSRIVSSIAAVAVALLFHPLQKRVQVVVDKTFFRIEYNFRESMRSIGLRIRDALNVEDLAECMINEINKILPTDRIGFFLLDPDIGYLQLIAHRGFPILERHGVHFEKEQLISSLQIPVSLPEHIEPSVEYETADRNVFERWEICLVCPILDAKKLPLAFLVLGKKKSGVRFTAEDIDLLTTVAREAGIALERLELQEKVVLEHAETERLGELNRMKSLFVSSVSHDMKTPLTSIRMFAELLRTKPRSDKEAKNFLQIIEAETDRLTRLINNVLDFSKIERGIKEYRFEDVELNDQTRRALESMSFQFTSEHVDLKKKLFPEDLVIRADRDALMEALQNLLTNAVKYTPEKKEIGVSTGTEDSKAYIRVEDNGIGISSAEVQKIFEPFYRAPEGRDRGVGGVGLGLSIVKHIMDAHHGLVRVESHPGKGSSFTLLFPTKFSEIGGDS